MITREAWSASNMVQRPGPERPTAQQCTPVTLNRAIVRVLTLRRQVGVRQRGSVGGVAGAAVEDLG